MVLKELIFTFLIWECVVVFKELILDHLCLGTCGGLERTHFYQFLFWGGWWS